MPKTYRVAVGPWDLASRKEIVASQRVHGIETRTAAWSPDSKLLVTGGNDMIVRIWDVRAGAWVDDGTLIDYDVQGSGPPVVLICAGPPTEVPMPSWRTCWPPPAQ